jgi:HlyD family secretion protein
MEHGILAGDGNLEQRLQNETDNPGMSTMPNGLRTNIFQFFSRVKGGLASVPTILRDPRRRWRLIVPTATVLAVAGGAIYYYEGVYLPSQKAAQPALQTTAARRGSIVLSASGTGTLQAANQADLSFKAGGKLTKLDVKVGDQVKEGQLLAELDNSSQQIQLQQAKQTLAGQTSAAAIASAQEAIATATKSLQSAENALAYLISPPVYYWENKVTKDQQAVKDAEVAAGATPTDQGAQGALKKAQASLASAQARLIGAQASYEQTYVPNHFTYFLVNQKGHHNQKLFEPPTDVDILQARSAVTVAQGALTDATNLYAALTGGTLPDTASGSGLTTLGQAQLSVQSAQDSLQATQLTAPFSGTVIAVDANVGDSVGNSTVMTIADLSRLYVKTYVDPSDYTLFSAGNTANVVFDALPDQTFSGKVVQVSPALDTSSGSSVVSGLVELDPTTTNLLIGMSGSVDVISAQVQSAVLVPLAALHEYSPGKYAVFVMRNEKPTVQFVEVGLKDLVSAEIKSGLQAGDVVSTGLVGTKAQ